MKTLDRIVHGMAYAYGAVLGVGLACTSGSLLPIGLQAACRLLAPLF
ncbi:hypothetical protein [Mesorhizobium argentiipisi]|uniref:Uncharacterized protein n=1 Tax=Mesorhizobium argentiipisi TaxID=3015175 RepID=A0ABU8KB04_9HYPH